MRLQFDEQLALLNKELITMGEFCEEAISKSTKALLEADISLAKNLPKLLEKVNQKERQIENICLRLLLQQQPVAKDLRTISSALKMVTDMERIGDQSADISEIVTMAHIDSIDENQPFGDMAKAVIKMVTNSVDAFVTKDVEAARSVINYDDIVDDYFDSIKTLLIDQLKNHNADGEKTLDLLMIAKYLERIGDHAVNVAKWVIFSIVGNREIVE